MVVGTSVGTDTGVSVTVETGVSVGADAVGPLKVTLGSLGLPGGVTLKELVVSCTINVSVPAL